MALVKQSRFFIGSGSLSQKKNDEKKAKVHLSEKLKNSVIEEKTTKRNRILPGPNPPILDSIETKEHEAIISYFPPKEANITFHIEYYPEDQPEYANVIETKASLVKLRGLDSGTSFRIKIRSIYNGVSSQEIIESSFRTEGTPEYDYSYSGEVFTIRTLPPGFSLATTTPSSDYDYSTEDEKEQSKAAASSTAVVTTTTAQTTTTSEVVNVNPAKTTTQRTSPTMASTAKATTTTLPTIATTKM
ncbi:fibronectin type III domain protein [Ancylostoma caninum]|uniref:Fibronectin type III domain protein n=1 Tax=Ancylostoma caninum TaxID=29170 RepID=A0A368FNT4_ANCCA|nr:fibronectin type III domain protein [Ancylostoma caninum]